MDGDFRNFMSLPEPEGFPEELSMAEKPLTPLGVIWTVYYWSFAVLRDRDVEHHPAVMLLAVLAVTTAYTIPLLLSSGMWKTALVALVVWPVLTTVGLFTEIFVEGLL